MEKRLDFWNKRAELGFKAGSNDEILKDLEISEIKKYLNDGLKILEIGCGNGITAHEIAKSFNVNILSVDYSPKMIENANNFIKENANINLKGKVKFKVMDVRELNLTNQKYDIVISERTLINLDSFEEQLSVINKIHGILSNGGIYIMCESSKKGLERINNERSKFDLDKIKMPWHNNYIDDEKLNSNLDKIHLRLDEINHFSSSYYLLSRIINANYAKLLDQEINYNSLINKMAYKLKNVGDFSQTKIWKWVK